MTAVALRGAKLDDGINHGHDSVTSDLEDVEFVGHMLVLTIPSGVFRLEGTPLILLQFFQHRRFWQNFLNFFPLLTPLLMAFDNCVKEFIYLFRFLLYF